jgi:uncharacterized protein YciI
MPRFALSLFALVILFCLPACRFGSSAPEEHGYSLVYLKTGAKTHLGDDEKKTIFEAHFANMQRMASEHQLVLAGPFGKEKHDPALRGLFLLATDDPTQAKAWAETDPGFQAGVFVLEYHPLQTHAALHALLEQELARNAQEAAAGKHPEPGEFGRNYVLLTAQKGVEMQHELAGRPFALLHGRIDGGRGWAVLDAQDPAAALELIGASREHMGAIELDAWFATRGLEQLPTLVD